MAITSFLNQFEKATKSKLAVVSEKMAKLERSIELCEAAFRR